MSRPTPFPVVPRTARAGGWEYLVLLAFPVEGSLQVFANDVQLTLGPAQTVYDYLQHLGTDGWELVSATYASGLTDTRHERFYFKRPLATGQRRLTGSPA